MARSDPDKLAAALRANLRRRKAPPAPKAPETPEASTEKSPEKPSTGQG